MVKRLTIYVGAPVVAALDGVVPGLGGQGGDPGSRSGRINAVCERYLMICAASCPALSRGEWLALCDALNGAVLDKLGIEAMDLSVLDADEGQIERWGVDRGCLAARLLSLDVAGRVAVAEAVERWWRSEGDHDARLAAAAMRLSGD